VCFLSENFHESRRVRCDNELIRYLSRLQRQQSLRQPMLIGRMQAVFDLVISTTPPGSSLRRSSVKMIQKILLARTQLMQ